MQQQTDLSSHLTDALSQHVHDVLKINEASAYTRLVVRGPGTPEAKDVLHRTTTDQLLAKPVANDAGARALLAGLWLWHDWLDPSHVISQDLHDASGSFWHAIMHRREGDFSNAKYWYARCAGHMVLQQMAPYANDILHPLPADKMLLRLVRDGWDHDAYVDLVKAVHDTPTTDPRHGAAIMLQKLEWRLLFNHSMRQASGQ